MKNQTYELALRAMDGELQGLNLSDREFLAFVRPRFIVRPPKEPKAGSFFPPTREEIISTTGQFIGQNWKNRPGCLDVQYLMKDYGEYECETWLPRMFSVAKNNGAQLAPVISMADNTASRIVAFRQCINYNLQTKAVIRLNTDDLNGRWAEIVQNIMNELGIEPRQARIIIDFAKSDTSNATILSDIAIGAYQDIRELGQWQNISMQGSNFPPSNSSEIGKLRSFPRTEWAAWLLARMEVPELGYGDYGPDASKFIFKKSGGGGPPHRIYRYTTPDNHCTIRGAQTGPEVSAMKSNAKFIIEAGIFAGRQFSRIDDFIFRVAQGLANPGRPTNWRATNIAHHIARVVRDISHLQGIDHKDFKYDTIDKQEELFN